MRIMEHKKLLYLDADLDHRLRALATRRRERVSVIVRDALRVGLAVIEGRTLAEIAAEATPETPKAE